MTTAVATKANTDISVELMDDILETAGDGAHYDASEMQIPFVRVLQALSPQLNKNKPEFIKGASAGRAKKASSSSRSTKRPSIWSSFRGRKVVATRVSVTQATLTCRTPHATAPRSSCPTATSS